MMLTKIAPDLVLINGDIITLNGKIVEALAAKQGRIIYLGRSKEALSFISNKTKVIDLDGKAVIPGFIDTHIHFINLGLSLSYLDLKNVESISELKELIKDRADRLPVDRWIIGWGWDQEKFVDGRWPNRWDLDEVTPLHPTILYRICGHVAIVNSLALKIAGINRNSEDPPGGSIDKNNYGEPTGILRENAIELVKKRIPEPSFEEYIRYAKLAINEIVKHGITTIHLMSASPIDIKILQELRRRGDLKVRTRLYMDYNYLEYLVKLGISRGFGDEYIRIEGIKLFIDGSLGSRTAALKKPYNDDPNNKGMLVINYDKLKDIISIAHKANLQVAIHAIGDLAVEYAIEVIGGINCEATLRHRIEHASILSPESINKISNLGIALSIQPRFIISDFWVVKRLGVKRAKWIYPFKSIIKNISYVGGGSDAPIEPVDPLEGIYSAVTRGEYENIELYRYTKSEALNILEAVKLYTKSAGYLTFEENLLGTLRIGSYADMVILSENILNVSNKDIKRIKVLMTIVGGEIVYINKNFKPNFL